MRASIVWTVSAANDIARLNLSPGRGKGGLGGGKADKKDEQILGYWLFAKCCSLSLSRGDSNSLKVDTKQVYRRTVFEEKVAASGQANKLSFLRRRAAQRHLTVAVYKQDLQKQSRGRLTCC